MSSSLPLSDLEPGARLAYDLRDSNGRLLLSAHRPVSEDILRALHRRGVEDLIFREAGELGEDGPKRTWLMAGLVDAKDRIGAAKPRVSETDTELASEAELDDQPPPPSPTQLRAALRRAAESVVMTRQPRWNRLPLHVEPAFIETPAAHAEVAEPAAHDGAMRDRRERAALVSRTFARLASGQAVGMGAIAPVIDELLADIARDPLAQTRLAIESASEIDDLGVHSLAVATVCATIASHLGWEDADVRSAALAGLFADCGLTLLPWDIRSAPRPLTDVETNALYRHPAWSAALVELIEDEDGIALDEAVQLAVYQHHEREDGSGYPTRARGANIHDLARLVGVADTFIGLISPRAHRPGITADEALAAVVRGASAGTLARPFARGLVLALGIRQSQVRAQIAFGSRTHRSSSAIAA